LSTPHTRLKLFSTFASTSTAVSTKNASPIHPSAAKFVVFTMSNTCATNTWKVSGICATHSTWATASSCSVPMPKPFTSANPTARIGTSEVSVTKVSEEACTVRSSSM
jgi:hypothetical protein